MTPTDPGAHPPHHYTDEEMHNEDVAYEHADISIQTLVTFAIGLLIVVALSAGLMRVLFVALESQAEARDPQVSPVAATREHQPPTPQLLRDEPKNLKTFRDDEDKKLDGYAWVDERGGLARVPIEEAKKLLVKQGLPVRSGGVEDPKEGTNAPAYGEASGGRTIDIPKAPAAPAPPPPPQAPAGEVKK
jgi:hypothetical protein